MRFFTSDLHLGHTNILEYCPARQDLFDFDYKSAAEGAVVAAMNEALIHNWNSVVSFDDEVIIDGDLCLGKIDQSLALVPRLNGHKRLLPGNHDRCWSHAKKHSRDWKSEYEAVGLEILPEQVEMTVGGYEVLVCHFPYRGDSHDTDRYLYARPFDEGKILLCGHVHDSWLISGRQINVGVDVHNYHPVPESEIIRLIEEVVHHGARQR